LCELSGELSQARPGQRLRELKLNFSLNVGGHLKLPKTKPYKPAGRLSREQTWRRRNALRLDEIALVLARFDHIAGSIRARQDALGVIVWRGWMGLGTLAG